MNKKKSTSLFDRFLFLVNSILAIALLLAYILPFISPTKAPSLAILSLFVPVFFVANILFIVFWILRLKKQFLLSTVVILLGFGYIGNIYKFSNKEIIQSKDLSLMSYNVRMFNHYGWNPNDSIAEKAYDFINQQKPNILAMQEFYSSDQIGFKYPYEYIKPRRRGGKFGMAIYSQFPIINSGSLDLENSSNNIIFADVLYKKDTIRVYNIHLESMRLNPQKENFGEKNSDKLVKRLKEAFTKQGEQTEKFLTHQATWKGKSIVCGDFNNTAFSWVYRQIIKNKQDAFKIAGEGTGSTFDYAYPLRIDFILPDESFVVNHFKTFDVQFSDHFPILTRLELD